MFLTRLLRRLRGLGTCAECGGPTIGLQCPACLNRTLVKTTACWLEDCSDNEILRAENRLLSGRLMVHDIIASKAKHDG